MASRSRQRNASTNPAPISRFLSAGTGKRGRRVGTVAFTAFDLLELDGQSVMGEPWTVRRKRLEDLLEPPPLGICLVPVTDDAPALWDAWVGMGGEGIVLKERTSLYRPGARLPAWLKLKPKLSLDV